MEYEEGTFKGTRASSDDRLRKVQFGFLCTVKNPCTNLRLTCIR